MPISIRPQSTDADRRERSRDAIAAKARRGFKPHEIAHREEIEWAFAHHPDQLAELEQIADQATQERTARTREKQQHAAIKAEADRVIAAWDAEENLKRRRAAEAQARRNLGLDADA